ncbi:MAG TPA: DUF4232 domain-containing protein, partial [Candidatus Limnocylindria bacterium]|nr:DUF4232 domain-containing protein [Candidatus Limnocylindria bacterium]
TSAAPGTIQALGDYGLTGRVDTYALPSGQLVLDLNVTGTSDVFDAVTWSLVPGTCAAWAAPGNAATTGQALYQFIAPVAGSTPHRIFRVTTPALNNTAPLALTAARSDSGEKAACADLRVEPYTARAIPPSAAPANCPVTRPPSPTFIPPSDYVAVPASSSEFWYGNAGLFVLLPADGSWVGLPYHDDAYFQKVFWGHQGYNWLTEQQPNITVTGRRLDAPAPPLEADRPTNAASPDMGSMMLTGVNFPTRGCWEVSGEYQGNTLSFVVWLGADTTPVGPSATPASTPIMGPPTPVVTAAPCHVGLMQLGVGNVSEPTGQHSLSLTLTNRSTQPCSLFGYPLISFFDAAGKQLPFDFQNSGDQVVTSKPPQLVVLAPGGAAYVTVNKYRCDAGEQGVAAGLRLGLPGDGTDPLAPLQADFSPDTMRMAYCGPGDPGSTVAVSPVAATFLATLNAH